MYKNWLLNILDADESNFTSEYLPSEAKLEFAKNQCSVWLPNDVCKVLGRQYKSTLDSIYPLLCHIQRYVHDNIADVSDILWKYNTC